MGLSIENPREYVKDEYVYRGLPSPKGFDQLDVFNGQCRAERNMLKNVDYIISDSPVAMTVRYAQESFEGWEYLLGLSRIYDAQYPPLNILLDRTGIKYDTCGRYQTEEEANLMHSKIVEFLESHGQQYVTMRTLDVADKVNEIAAMLC